jgi:hypothetical protein
MFWMIARVVGRLGGLGGGGGGAPAPQKRLAIDEKVLWQSIQESLKTMEEFEKFAREEMAKIMRTEMANVAARSALATPPLNGKGVSEGEKNVEEDISFIFKPLENIPFGSLVLARHWTGVAAYNFKFKSKRLQKAYDTQNWEVIYKAFGNKGMGKFNAYDEDFLLVTGQPSKERHRGALDRNGRLNGIRWHVSGPKDQAQAKIDTYIKFMQQGIGKMAGGWIKCFKALKGQGWNLPLDWATKGKGKVTENANGIEHEIVMENNFGNYGGFADQRYATFNYILHESSQKGAERYVRNCQEIINRLNMN